MINNKKVLAIVPARGGSKGIIKKNIRLVNNKPLIQFTLDETIKSKYIDEIHISTDDDEILEVIQKLGYDIKRKRPQHLAQDNTKTIDVLKDVVEYYAQKNESYEIVILLQPTQPMRKVKHIDEALEKYVASEEQSIVSVSKVKEHPLLMRSINKRGLLVNLLDENSTVRRQDFKEFYMVNGAIYVNSVDEIMQNASLNDNKLPYIMGEDYRNIDIDTIDDLNLFEYYLSKY